MRLIARINRLQQNIEAHRAAADAYTRRERERIETMTDAQLQERIAAGLATMIECGAWSIEEAAECIGVTPDDVCAIVAGYATMVSER